jgi:hypothetical protein
VEVRAVPIDLLSTLLLADIMTGNADPKCRWLAGPSSLMIIAAVTRVEEWCVEAQTPEEARALLAAGEGHRCHLGDCLHRELEAMESPEEAA